MLNIDLLRTQYGRINKITVYRTNISQFLFPLSIFENSDCMKIRCYKHEFILVNSYCLIYAYHYLLIIHCTRYLNNTCFFIPISFITTRRTKLTKNVFSSKRLRAARSAFKRSRVFR